MMMLSIRTLLLVAMPVLCWACSPASDSGSLVASSSAASTGLDRDTMARLEFAMDAVGRPNEDKALDVNRRPIEVLSFFQIPPGAKVLDVGAGDGYYAELLAALVGPNGEVVAQNETVALNRQNGALDAALSARLADNRLPNVKRHDGDLDALSTTGHFDAALVILTLHDFYNFQGEQATIDRLRTLYTALKAGGVLGVVDHVGEQPASLDLSALHRIEQSVAERLLREAGFNIEADSDLLANPQDDHTRNVFEPPIRRRTDRFVIRAKRPG